MDVQALKTKSLTEFIKVKKYIMDEVSSHDIDAIEDFEYCEFLISKNA